MLIQLDGYVREHDDRDKGIVRNVGTEVGNPEYGKIAYTATLCPSWWELPESALEKAQQIEAVWRKVAPELSQPVVRKGNRYGCLIDSAFTISATAVIAGIFTVLEADF